MAHSNDGGTGHLITDLYVWVAQHSPTSEGIASMQTDFGHMPLVSSSSETAELMRRVAQEISQAHGVPIVLKHYRLVED